MIKIYYKNIEEPTRDNYKLYSALYSELEDKGELLRFTFGDKNIGKKLIKKAIKIIKKELPLSYRFSMFWHYTFGICRNEAAITYLWELADYDGIYFDIVSIIDDINAVSDKKLWKERKPDKTFLKAVEVWKNTI